MDLALYAVQAVLVEGRSVRDVARSTGRSKAWVQRPRRPLSKRGEEALVPRRRGPKVSPNQTPAEVEATIVALRKDLVELGLDAGARTIAYHLGHTEPVVPASATIHRILVRRGFVTDQPQKRPRSSWQRFEAGGCPPMQAWRTLDRSTPVLDGQPLPPATKVRHDKIDTTGVVTLRHRSKLHHIGVGRAHKGRRALLLVCDLDIRVIAEDGELLRRLTLDPSVDYQAISRTTI